MNSCIQDLNQFILPKGFRGRSAIVVQIWWIIQALFFNTSPQFMYSWRRYLLILFGARIGQNVLIRPSVRITYPWKVKIGDFSWIGDNVELYSLGEIEIGKNVVISQRSYLCSASHDYKQSNFPIFDKKILIGDECWLATDVYIAPGVIVGHGTVIGARSSVFSNLPSDSICWGSPAKFIKKRFDV